MYLKEIELKGFKSFANKIKLSITPGITVIVGPNGCGKSNITDAVRWIIGEQNIRSLRGNNLTDMIFAGNKQQKMRNFAEVSILFDNLDHKFALDSEQVEIKRAVYRSGNTENYINGIPCKLRDIHNLFLGTGLGKNSYSIIAQGKVDFVLNSKPSERRILFEEAANISSYKNKKETTIKRLDSVKSNLTRIDDILSEVKENLNYYKKKADDLNLYYSYRDYIKKSEFYLLSQQYLLYEKNIIKYVKMLKHIKDELKTIENILNNCKKTIANIENKKILLEKQLHDIEKSFQTNESEKINCNNQLILLKQKQSEIVQRIKNIQEDIRTSNEQYKKFKETIISIEKDIQKANSNHSVIAQNKNNYDVLLKKYHVILNYYSKAISVIKDDKKYFTEQYINKYREQKIKEETMIRSIDYSLQDIKKEYFSISNELHNNQKWLHDIENNLTDYENEKTSLQQEKMYLEKSLNKSKLIVEEEGNILRNFNNDIILKSKEKDFLVELVKNQPNKENTINEYILKRSDFQNQVVIFSEIIEKIHFIPDNLKDTIQFILNDKLDILLANSTEMISILNNILKSNHIGQAQLITDDIFEKEKYKTIRNNIKKKYANQEKVLGFANELIKYPPEYDSLFKILLGHILVVEDINTALNIYKPQKENLAVISLDGIFIDINGIITLNTFSENGKNVNMVLPAAKIGQLDREIMSIKSNLTKHENNYKKAKNDSLLFLKRIKEIDNKIDFYLNKINKNNNNIIEINNNISELEKQLKSLNLKKNAELDKKQYLNKNIEISQSNIEKILNYNQSVKNYNNCILKIRNICKNSIGIMQKKIENSKMEISWDQERKSLLQKRKVEMEHFIQTYHQEEQLREKKLIQYNNEKSQLIKEADYLEKQLKKIIEKIKILDDKRNNIKENIREQETKLRKTHEDIEKNQTKYEEKKNKYHENEMVKVQNQEKKNNLLSTIKEQYNSSVNEIMMYQKELRSQKEAYTKIAKYKEKITAMGQLNFDALQEYKNQSERYDDLQNKKNDIIESQEKLINLIKEIDRIAEDNFYKTFLKVENSFKDIFQKLFNGGQVSLELTNENKLLETGIEVMVQPPGKKLQNISLLSTGEKALTAIALLFALWKANPSPFCLFDEIDSALDESNAIRLASFLRNEDLKDAQIIIITHQRGVMESADALYGITMEGSGISKLMSVKILDTEEQKN